MLVVIIGARSPTHIFVYLVACFAAVNCFVILQVSFSSWIKFIFSEMCSYKYLNILGSSSAAYSAELVVHP